MYDTIVVPTDGSEHAMRAAEHGRYLARAFDATVHVITVVDAQATAGPFDAGGVDERLVARLEEQGENAIETVEAALEGVESTRTAVLRGDPPRRSSSTRPITTPSCSRWGHTAEPDCIATLRAA